MKKNVFKILFLFVFIFILITIGHNVKANTINSISMDIYVDKNGDAFVTETWNCRVNEGTESYHPYYNLGASVISDLTVSDESNTYTTLSSWNTSGSLSSKAYKCGLNRISNGIEICWGISSYGSHTYTVKYKISNFVANLTDAQMIYWTLIPYEFSTPIGNAYIKIYTDFHIEDTTDVWGYGNYGGTCYVYDGYIEMQSDGRLSTDEYMTILAKFPSGTFNTTNNLNYNFEHYLNMSQEGATKYESSESGGWSTTGATIAGAGIAFIGFFFNAFFYIFIAVILVKIFGKMTPSAMNFGPEGKKFSKDTPYFRDIPSNKDLFRAYYIAYEYKINSKKEDLLGAVILKWLKEKYIRIEQRETGAIFKKENTVIVMNEVNPEIIADHYENKLFKMMYEASKDGYLESKEFEKWCRKSYSKILSWFDDIIERQKEKLVNEGLITVEEITNLKIFKSKKYTATPELRREAEEIYGLKRYLQEYTLIPEREPIEVELFEEYMIFAQMLGIAKKVAKDFKDLYPQLIEQSNFYSYDYIMFIHTCSYQGVSAANSARERAESYSSGGGGFSSGGGGGGSFGGGGGGRRLPLKLIKTIVNKCKICYYIKQGGKNYGCRNYYFSNCNFNSCICNISIQ